MSAHLPLSTPPANCAARPSIAPPARTFPQTDSFARDEFLVQCKLEARRLSASQERPRTSSSRDESEVDDDMLD